MELKTGQGVYEAPSKLATGEDSGPTHDCFIWSMVSARSAND